MSSKNMCSKEFSGSGTMKFKVRINHCRSFSRPHWPCMNREAVITQFSIAQLQCVRCWLKKLFIVYSIHRQPVLFATSRFIQTLEGAQGLREYSVVEWQRSIFAVWFGRPDDCGLQSVHGRDSRSVQYGPSGQYIQCEIYAAFGRSWHRFMFGRWHCAVHRIDNGRIDQISKFCIVEASWCGNRYSPSWQRCKRCEFEFFQLP